MKQKDKTTENLIENLLDIISADKDLDPVTINWNKVEEEVETQERSKRFQLLEDDEYSNGVFSELMKPQVQDKTNEIIDNKEK